ncbi:MAG: hypothetical protein FWC91_10445 [Defluviitaleaceae bacterium]|nr:hypothetical protein [Defluviitaleaceae bacterium]
MRKCFITVIALLVLTFSSAISLAASDGSAPIMAENTKYEENCIERQTELLHELMELQRASGIVAPFTDDGVSLEIPQINVVIPPTSDSGQFAIGLEICIGDLAYGDLDEILAITSKEPDKEVVDFILSFAEIPYSQANVEYAVFMPTPRLPENYVISGSCPVWGDELEDQIDPRSGIIVRVGNMDNVEGFGQGTIGHPVNANGSGYVTAIHAGSWAAGSRVFASFNNQNQLGVVSSSTLTNSVDITFINIINHGNRISLELPRTHNWPGGASITNFRGVPRTNDVVRSIRGRSGIHHTAIHSASVNIAGLTNKLTVYPNGISTTGDSGAALIRVSDSAVMGTRTGAVAIGNTVFGVYTSSQRY